ncbi:MAG: VWD domain-containing protein, partial [Flavobacteriales bacterium]
MKKTILLIGILTLTSAESFGQNDRFKENFQLVKNELVKWEPIRGEWLASSLYAMSNKQPVPDRTFPENLTPAEMWRLVPEGNRSSVNRIVTENQRVATDTTGRNEWNQVASVVNLPNCKPVSGRTYGDPHLSSFDGASYSFQTVGEFVLAKSDLGNFEIQARQQPQTDDFSLNTAVAMNVAGDRVGIYANEKPDNVSTSALRVNGVPVTISRSAYFLPHGGT